MAKKTFLFGVLLSFFLFSNPGQGAAQDWGNGLYQKMSSSGEPILKAQAAGPGRYAYLLFDPSGALGQEGVLLHGKPQGLIKTYYASGRLFSVKHYENGILEGPYRIFYPTGTLLEEGAFSGGLVHGKVTVYQENAKVFSTQFFHLGVKEDGYFRYHPDGRLAEELFFMAGRPEGSAREYDGQGRLKSEKFYKNGRLLRHAEFSSSGKNNRPYEAVIWGLIFFAVAAGLFERAETFIPRAVWPWIIRSLALLEMLQGIIFLTALFEALLLMTRERLSGSDLRQVITFAAADLAGFLFLPLGVWLWTFRESARRIHLTLIPLLMGAVVFFWHQADPAGAYALAPSLLCLGLTGIFFLLRPVSRSFFNAEQASSSREMISAGNMAWPILSLFRLPGFWARSRKASLQEVP